MLLPGKPRDSRGQRAAALSAGVSITLLMFFAAVISAPKLYEVFGGHVDSRRSWPTERIIYAVADHVLAQPGMGTGPSLSGRRRRSTIVPSPGVPPSIAEPGNSRMLTADPRDPVVPLIPLPALRGPQPVTAPPLGTLAVKPELTMLQRDSALFALEISVPRSPKLPPTPEIRDSLERERARVWATARDQGRPVAIEMGGGGFGIGLMASGPGRERRRRDSIIHAGNLKRLETLAHRARVRQDSVRRTDSIATLRRMDSVAMLKVP